MSMHCLYPSGTSVTRGFWLVVDSAKQFETGDVLVTYLRGRPLGFLDELEAAADFF